MKPLGIVERVNRLRAPIIDCAAAIDAARVLANITGKVQTIWLDLDAKRWHVRNADQVIGQDRTTDPNWHHAGGLYAPGEERGGIQTNPELTPELANERGILPMSREEYETSSVSWALAYAMANQT